MRKLTKEEIIDWLLTDGRGIRLIGEYTNSATKTLFRCQHGHEWSAKTNDIKNGQGCPHCSSRHRPTTNEFRVWLIEDDRGITLIGEYTNNATKTLFRCQHGHEWSTKPNSVKSGKGCPECGITTMASRCRLSVGDICEWLIEDGRGITLIGEYTNNATKTLFRCQHEHEWHARPNDIKSGKGCPECSTSGFNPNAPAWVYGWIRDNYLKVGITNDLPRRLKEHRKHGEISLVYDQYYPIGQHALDFERSFKQEHDGNYVTKEQCPDGYTETFPPHLLESLRS